MKTQTLEIIAPDYYALCEVGYILDGELWPGEMRMMWHDTFGNPVLIHHIGMN